jgi:hypothetical protein
MKTFNRFIKNLKIIISEGIYNAELPDYSGKIYKHFKFKLKDAIWVKENLINVAIDKLPEAEFIAWSDRDIYFLNPFWVEETLKKLKVSDIVQPWSQVIYTDIDYEMQPIKKDDKFFRFVGKSTVRNFFEKNAPFGVSTGQIWAITRLFYNKIKKINDIEIVGGADSIIAHYCILNYSHYPGALEKKSTRYTLQNWSQYKELFKGCSFDYVKGGLIHYWHGHLENRLYNDRHVILTALNYNPYRDIAYDENNIIYLTNEGQRLKEPILKYFTYRAKNEKIREDQTKQYIWDTYAMSPCLIPVSKSRIYEKNKNH